MGIINSNVSACGLVEKYIGTAYDIVKEVSNNIDDVDVVAGIVNDGRLDEVIDLGDDITLAAALINYKGDWQADVNYVIGESVTYGDVLWISDVDNLNSVPSMDNTDWTNINGINVDTINSYDDFPTVDSRIDSVILKGAVTPNDGGGGIWNWDNLQDKANANLGTILDPELPATVAAQGTGVGTGCWMRVHSGTVQMSWFKAVADDVTDNAEMIRTAVATGKFINFDSLGVYRVNSEVIFDQAEVTITGVGTIRHVHTDAALFRISAERVILDGLKFVGLDIEPTHFTGCIYVLAAKGVVIQNCKFKQIPASGVHIANSTGIVIRNNGFSDFYYYHSSAAEILSYGNVDTLIITGNHCSSDISQSIYTNALPTDSDVIIHANVVTNMVGGIEGEPVNKRHSIIVSYMGADPGYGRSIVSNNICTYAIWSCCYMNTSAENQSGSVIILGNIFKHFGYAQGITNTGGVCLLAAANRAIVSNNIIEEGYNDITGGIELSNSAGQTDYSVTVNNNRIANMKVGIRSTINALNNFFIDNVISNCTVAGIKCIENVEPILSLSIAWEIKGNKIELVDDAMGIDIATQGISEENRRIVVKDNFVRYMGTPVSTVSGIRFQAYGGIICTNNFVDNFKVGIELLEYITGRITPNEMDIESNHIDNCETGIVVKAGTNIPTFFAGRNSFDGCTDNYGGAGAYNASKEAVFHNNMAETAGSAAPTVGTWSLGDKVYNNAPATAAKIGWVCIQAGNPGTWLGFGTID